MVPRLWALVVSACQAGTVAALKLLVDVRLACARSVRLYDVTNPLPKPAINLPAMYCPKLNEVHCTILPMAMRVQPSIKVFLRPSTSPRKMVKMALTKQPMFQVAITTPVVMCELVTVY